MCFMTSLPNTMIFFVEKNEFSHFHTTKNIGVFEILTFEILTLPNNIVSFEQPGPDYLVSVAFCGI